MADGVFDISLLSLARAERFFYLSLAVSGRPLAASEGVGPPRLKTKTKCRNSQKQPARAALRAAYLVRV